MATNSHRDDDPAKKPNGEKKTPKPTQPVFPDMSLDKPEEEPLLVEEVLEAEEVPVVEASPESAVDAFVLSDADIVEAEAVEEIVDAAPADDEPILIDDAVVIAGSSAVHVEPAAEVAAPAPTSDVDLMALLSEAAVHEPAPAAPATPEFEQIAAAEEIAAAAPAEDVTPAELIFEEAVAEPAELEVVEVAADVSPEPTVTEVSEAEPEAVVAESPSDIVTAEDAAEEIAEATPASDVLAEDVLFDEAVAESAPVSEPRSAEVVEEAVEAVDEVSSATRKSEAVLDDEISEAEEAVSAAEATEEADVVASGSSGVVLDEISEAEEAVSAAEAAEEADVVASGSSGVVLDEISEAEEAVSAAEATEEASVVASGSSGVVLDEVTELASGVKKKSASSVAKTAAFEQTMAFDPPSSASKKVSDDDLLVTEEELGEPTEASAVNLGEMPARKSSAVSGIDSVAEALESGVELDAEVDDPSLKKTAGSVEFDELLDEDFAHEVDTPVRKKKPAAAVIDDEITEMNEEAVEEAEEAAEEVEEAVEAVEDAEEVEEPVLTKKGKAPVKATGDDIDLAEMFSDDEAEPAEVDEAEADEAEAAEAFDAEEAEVAEAVDAEEEAAVAFDEELDATEAVEAEDDASFFDEDDQVKPAPKAKTKAGKKSRISMDDEDEAEAVEDEDEDLSAKKKKSKKDKATVAPVAAGRSGCFFPVVVGMFLAILLLGGGGGAAWYYAPEKIEELVSLHPERQGKDKPKPPDTPKGTELTKAQKARQAIAEGNFQKAVDDLADAADKDELSARGEARWLVYYKEQVDKKGFLDENAEPVKTALDDLNKGENKLLVAQIRGQFDAAGREKALADQLAKLKTDKDDVDKLLTTSTADKVKAEKLIDSLADVLVKGKFIDDKASFDVASLQKIMKGLSDDRTILESVNKILKDGDIKGSGEDGIKEVLKIKKGLEEDVASVTKVLSDEKTKDKGAKGVLEIVDVRNKMTKEAKELAAVLEAAFKELVDGKIITDPKADARKDTVAGVKSARQKAESPLAIPLGQLGLSLGGIGTGTSKVVEQSFSTAKLAAELGWFQGREKFIEAPEQKMNTYITLLHDRKQNDAKRLADISREAEWVIDPASRADAESRGKARYVQGLAHRNLERFAEARTAIAEALKAVQKLGKSDVWAVHARKTHDELTDPTIYFLPRIEGYQGEQNFNAALAEANLALKALPGDARLHAQRALVRLDLFRGKGAKIPVAAQKDIRADADAAKDKLASESAYINGLLDEELQNWPEAEKNLRMAIKLTDDRKGTADESGKYRVALARILLRDRPEVVPAPPAQEDKKKDDKGASIKILPSSQESLANLQDSEPALVLHPWSLLIVSAVISQDSDEVDDPAAVARYKEAVEEAYKLIASKNEKLKGEGYLALGKALSKLGKRSEGLKAYTEGLKLIHKGITTTELKELLDEHPAFQQPDISSTPNPVMAERHFGEAMHFYWAKNYTDAETHFRQAVKYYDKDARYQYYLGLSQWAQKTKLKRDAAIYSFEQGARLEAKAASTNPLAAREINASLERIQGKLREELNGYRYKTYPGNETPAPEAK